MRKKTYNYEKFTTCTELLSEFKNAKKNQKIILGTFSKYFLKISIYFVFWKKFGGKFRGGVMIKFPIRVCRERMFYK